VSGYAAALTGSGFCQCQGSSSWMRLAGWLGRRARTSASQARGSMPFSLALSIRVYIAAARRPPSSEPANVQLRLPTAIPRSARSAALFDKQTLPSSRKRVKAGQRFSR
jgi:hypothetical protein